MGHLRGRYALRGALFAFFVFHNHEKALFLEKIISLKATRKIYSRVKKFAGEQNIFALEQMTFTGEQKYFAHQQMACFRSPELLLLG